MDHFIPTEAEIAEVCRRIREQGWWDRKGVFHAPWTTEDLRSRRMGRMVESRTNRLSFASVRFHARVSQRKMRLRTLDRLGVSYRGFA